MNSTSAGKIINVGFALALTILVLVTGVSFRNTRRLTETRELVTHTYIVIDQLEKILTRLVDVETGNRGYVITGQEAYLEPFTEAKDRLDQDLKSLDRLTADNPSEQVRVAELARQSAQRLASATEGVRLRRVQGFEAGQSFLLNGQGKREMDEIRLLIAKMETVERELLEQRSVAARAETTRTVIAFSAGLSLSFALLLVVFFFLKRQIAMRRRGEQLLIRQKQELANSAEALLVQTNLLELILARIGDGVCVSDENGKFLVFNPAAEQILGVGPTDGVDRWSEAFGLYLSDTVTPYPSEQLPLARALRGESVDAELFMRNANAPEGKWLIATARPILNEDGSVRGGVSVFSDITQRKLFERTLEEKNAAFHQANLQLEAANQELEAFAYSVSHDLRAPLRHLAGFAELLQKNCGAALDANGTHYLDLIQEAAARMGVLIDDLLTFSRLGRSEMQRVTVDLNKLLSTVIADLHEETRERKISWSIGDLPTAPADPSLLRQVFVNLVSNAVKFTRNRPEAEIEVGCRDNGDRVTVFVRDNGAGFDMKYVAKLFGVFQRLHRTDEFEGTGIGLANVRRIIARHGGETWAESLNGGGATFYFSLPMAKASNQ
jgi:PAS domain S-box-containing protein